MSGKALHHTKCFSWLVASCCHVPWHATTLLTVLLRAGHDQLKLLLHDFFFFPLPLPPTQCAPSDVEQLLIGNKCDWEERRAVESERGEQLARSQGIPFLEISARTGHNIDEVRGQLMMSL